MELTKQLALELALKPEQVAATVALIDRGNTIPFIARYRKEVTGSLDDNVLRELEERLHYLRSLQKRREEVASSLENQGVMTEDLQKALLLARTLAEVEDIYRPHRPKRRTRASIAKERGLEPLALLYMEQTHPNSPLLLAQPFVSEERGVPTPQDALAGAKDILAERISDQAEIRKELREFLMRSAVIQSTGDLLDDSVYAMYRGFSEPVSKVAGHRILAMDRGEREGLLKVSIVANESQCLSILCRHVVKKGGSPSTDVVKEAAFDALTRLIYPSLEREVRAALTQRAAQQAIKVFALNLKPLLMQPPVKGKVAMGFDPAYRTGCKIAVVDPTGKVLDTAVVYPTQPHNKIAEATSTLTRLIKTHQVSIIAVGNGTASKESEIFLSTLLREQHLPAAYMMVSEAGASVYSASKLGAEEFPQYDVSLRSAISIARRLQDPLAELVKIDPKSIGVGQYQHDMPRAQLDLALGGVVEECVNAVGVDVNTASQSLLSYVAGIGPSLAKNMVKYREENGSFSSRRELMEVPKLGKKAFEQSAGFLRVAESEHPLDNTAVHPESYQAAEKLLTLCGYGLRDVKEGRLGDLRETIRQRGEEATASQLNIGVPTLLDMVKELLKPGRDPRDSLPPPLLRTDVLELADLHPGMVLDGTVRNVTDFGAFVDIGVHQDGLVHISQICEQYIKHPSEKVRVGDVVRVRVLEADPKRKRISLSMRQVFEELP